MGADEPFSSGRILMVVAHPDDEVIGAGAQFPCWSGCVDILHGTNGSPANLKDALSAGLSTADEYERVRRQELLHALALADVSPDRCHQAGFRDQEASFHLAEFTRRVLDCIKTLHPSVVLTHPYEGGHPDHDACAFAVQSAIALAGGDSNLEIGQTTTNDGLSYLPQRWEFTSYHMGRDGIETGKFLPGPPEIRYQLNHQQQRLKRRMVDCFRTQQQVLSKFSLDSEAFRRAPEYDFTQPPHPGRLFYEQYDWGVTGPRWRELAAEALKQLGLELHATHCS
jgi:LmbE family N-acetylglucosaminyl deacetylase